MRKYLLVAGGCGLAIDRGHASLCSIQ